MKRQLQKILFPTILLVACIALGLWLATSEEVLMRRYELMNLFLPGETYMRSLMQYPGGMLSWMACWCTEFLYTPWQGCLLMALLWWLITLGGSYALRLKGVWKGLSLLPVCAILAAIVQSGYWVYYQKLEGYIFVPTLGVLFAVGSAVVYRLLDVGRSWIGWIWMALWAVVFYPLFGAWGLGGTLLMGGLAFIPQEEKPTIKTLWRPFLKPSLYIALALTAIVPQIWFSQYFAMTTHETIYIAGMPSFSYGQENYPQYNLPYYAIIASFVVMALSNYFRTSTKKGNIVTAICTLLFVAGGVYGVNTMWYRDANFHKEIEMTEAVEAMDWERVLKVYLEPSDSPATRVMVMFKNLALFRLGRAGEEMFLYPNGGEQQHAPWMVRMTQIGGKVLYYYYGKENFCYRWCMEDGVEFGWKVDYLKYLAKTSIINKDWNVARKYLNLLSQTRNHKEWADHYRKFLNHWDLVVKDPEMGPITHILSGTDWLDGDNTLIELYLLNNFSKGMGADPLFQELTLNAALIVKDIDLFWPRFFQYAEMHKGERMPRYYQEAAYLYGQLEPGKVDISHMPFDDSVRQSYQNFMKFNEQCGPMTEEQKHDAFRPQFGDTFYYFYFLERGVKTN